MSASVIKSLAENACRTEAKSELSAVTFSQTNGKTSVMLAVQIQTYARVAVVIVLLCWSNEAFHSEVSGKRVLEYAVMEQSNSLLFPIAGWAF